MRSHLNRNDGRNAARYVCPIIGYAYIGGIIPGLVSVYMPWGNLQDFVRVENPSIKERLGLVSSLLVVV